MHVRAYLRSHPADILLLQEVNDTLEQQFTQGIAVTERGAGPALGGDHTPLWVQFVLAAP